MSLAMRDHLGLVLEAEQRRDRAEGLLARRSRIAASTSASTVGSKKVPPSAWRLPPIVASRPLGQRVGDMRLDLFDRLVVISGPCVTPGSVAVADLQLADRLGQLVGERVVDPSCT